MTSRPAWFLSEVSGWGYFLIINEMKMEWISVEDRLPEFNERVLVLMENYISIYKLKFIDKDGCAWEKDCSFSFISGRDDIHRGVKKWMPLPKQPVK